MSRYDEQRDIEAEGQRAAVFYSRRRERELDRRAARGVRPEGYYWTRYRASPTWEVLYWRNGVFWDNQDFGYAETDLTVGPRIFPPAMGAAGQ